MKGYKAFGEGMVCKGKQYAENTIFEEEKANPCVCGMHFCKEPLAVLRYYPAAQAKEFAEVEALDEALTDDNTKFCTTKLKVGEKLSIRQLVDAQIDFIIEHCTNENNAETGKSATAGDLGAATAGSRGAATAGDSGAATAGSRGAATAGSRGAATAGDFGAATAGSRGAATAGSRGAAKAGYAGAATAGSRGAATAGSRGAATAGDLGAATAGYSGAATAGSRGAATAGSRGAATAGDFGAATAGNAGAATAGSRGAATAGYAGAATAGDFGAATAGSRGAATSRGKVLVGENGAGLVRCETPRAKGGKGAVLFIVKEKENSYDISDFCTVVVGENGIKPNTWYTVENGKAVEVDAN